MYYSILGYPSNHGHPSNRFYRACSLSGSDGETDSSPTRPVRGGRPRRSNIQQHTYQLPAGLSDSSPNSDNVSNATLTDSEVALARDTTLLAHKRSLLQVAGPDVPPRNLTMSRQNGRLGTVGSHHRPSDLEEFEPSCLVRTPSGSVYIPPGSINKSNLEYKTNISCDNPQKTDLQKTTERCAMNFTSPVPVLPIRNNLHRPSSTHHFPPQRFHFQKGMTSKCTWKCTAIVLIFISIVMAATLIYLTMSNVLHWSYQNSNTCSVVVDEENSEALAKTDDSILRNASTTNKPIRNTAVIADRLEHGGVVSDALDPTALLSSFELFSTPTNYEKVDEGKEEEAVSVVERWTSYRKNVRSLLQVTEFPLQDYYDEPFHSDYEFMDDYEDEPEGTPLNAIDEKMPPPSQNMWNVETNFVEEQPPKLEREIRQLIVSQDSGQVQAENSTGGLPTTIELTNRSTNVSTTSAPSGGQCICLCPVCEKVIDLGRSEDETSPMTEDETSLMTEDETSPMTEDEWSTSTSTYVSAYTSTSISTEEDETTQTESEGTSVTPSMDFSTTVDLTSVEDDVQTTTVSVTDKDEDFTVAATTAALECYTVCKGTKTQPTRTIPPDGTTFKEMKLGEKITNEVPPYSYWNMQFYQSEPAYVKFDYSFPRGTSVAVYGRKNALPTHTQYHMVELLNGFKNRGTRTPHGTEEKEVTHFLDPGQWFLSLYNDNGDPATISVIASISEDMTQNCPNGCSTRGHCVLGKCKCNTGYGGDDCSQNVCPVLCNQRGDYVNGECQCNPGWKGKDCSLRHDECEVADCNGHGQCSNGQCMCVRGFKGKFCQEIDCPHPTCNAHGVCLDGTCVCKKGWKGADCSQPDKDALQCLPDCSGHGKFDIETQLCKCDSPWTGDDCSREICDVNCGAHGHCVGETCTCDFGWSGEYCNVKLCDPRCNEHGQCKNGTCLCVTGWNGKHCTLEGCPSSCSSHGQCRVNIDNAWECQCSDGWFGRDCSVQLESNCTGGGDDDKDGLTDCEDPECCKNEACKASQLCVAAPLPKNILNKKQPPIVTASFFERSKFLIEEGSLQNYAKQENFSESRSAVVRGRIITAMGMGLMGVRVSTSQAMEGFTLTREDGEFDLLVNGGGAVKLHFGRSPFKPQSYVTYVPWNEIVMIDTITMSLSEDKSPRTTPQICKSHNYDVMKPIVLATWKHSFQGGCPDRSAILAESQVIQESVQIPGTGLNLIYHSSKSPGYLSTIQLQLTPDSIPATLKMIHLSIAIEGILFEKKFEADPNIRYTYAWNRLNVYKQRVYGVTTALVKVGYEYTDCKDILWDTQTTKLSGNDMSISEVGGWNLDIHHRYNFHEGILQKGDGSNIYLKHKPRVIKSSLGDGHQRPLECNDCDGSPGEKTRLLAPVSLAAAADGSLFIGDFNLIRRRMVNGVVRTVVRLNVTKVAYRYHMAVSPLDGTLYISDPESHQILKVRDINHFSDPDNNWEPFIGSGERCLPGDEAHCGDGGLARDAKLAYPKGLAVSSDNIIYFADGTNIRMVDQDGIVSTIIGNHMHKSHWKPIPCEGTLTLEEVHLRWPTDLAINPLDNSLHIVDDHMILRLTADGRVKVIVGRPLQCPPLQPIDPDLEFASQATLVMPQSITFAANGDLYIGESDSQRVNRIRIVGTDGRITHYAGSDSKCNCLDRKCNCHEESHLLAANAKFKTISTIAITPDGVLYIADQANYRVYSVTWSIPAETDDREYEVYSPETQELYIFNRFGQHIATKNILTGEVSYTFTYTVNTSSGKLNTITDTAGNKVFILRDYSSQVNSIENTKGQKCRLRMSRMRMLSEITTPDNYNITFDYHGDTGLLRSKLDSAGRSFVYHYDDFGRLTGAVTPTGKAINLVFDLSIKGATVKATYDDKQTISMTVRGSSVITKTGGSEKRTSITTDGSLLTILPWGSTIATEVVPYQILADGDSVLAESYPVPAKQKTEIGSEVTNRFEWKYFQHKVAGVTQQKGSAKPVQVGRKLRVNGVNQLSLEYDRDSKTMGVFLEEHHMEILNVTYDRTARPLKWIPKNSAFAGVQLEYDRFSRLSVWRWGALTEKYGYDRAGRLSEIRYADETSTVYAFKDMFSGLPLKVTTPRGSDYLLEYDDAGALKSLTTPRGHIHTFTLQTSLGFYKYQYYSPVSRHPFELHYDEEGKIMAKLYPHHSGKVTYVFDQSGRIETVLTGLSSIHYTYQENTNLVKNIDTIEPGFELKDEFGYQSGLLSSEKLRFGIKTNLHNVEINYQYDGNARVSLINTAVNNKGLPEMHLKFNANLGVLEGVNDFRMFRNGFNRTTVQDGNKQFIKVTDYDSHARVKSIALTVKAVDVYKLELEYDSRSRISNVKVQFGQTTYNDRIAYSADGHLVDVAGKNNWKYLYDENGNAVGIVDQGQKLLLGYDSGDRIVQVGDVELKGYDVRGFVIRNGQVKLSYDESGHLSHATDTETFGTFYRYDHRGRLISIHDRTGNITQFLYTDPHRPELITVLYSPKHQHSTILYYDNSGVLVALEYGNQRYYVAPDQNGSPLLIFDASGRIFKEVRRTPFGRVVSDTNLGFYVPVGFQGGIPDPHTGLVYLNKRWYDPAVGQWMTPDWEKLANQMTTPTDIFIYRFHNNDPINPPQSQRVNYMTDLNSWMQVYGYNTKNMLGSAYLQDMNQRPLAQISSPQLAPDFGLMSGLQCIVEKVTEQFNDFGFVPQPLLKMESRTRNLLPRVAYRKSIFGEGLLISKSESGRALISTVEGVNSVVQDVITSVFNNSHFLDLHFTHHDQDLFFFVKDNPLKIRDDTEELRRLGSMFNATTHDTTNGKELRLHSVDALISVRYGVEPQQERHQLLKHAHKRAVDRAWELEKNLVSAGLSGARVDWTDEEKEELLSRGHIEGYDGVDIHSVQRYPELADDPGNIAFKKDGTKRKRKRRNHGKVD